jgi:lipid II:glycine glycyltransferase (peptidoglycan interpeptide bridge formation enzyme)
LPNVRWNERLAALHGHLLQSWEWGDFKQRHGWTPHRILVEVDHGVAMAQVLYRSRAPVSVGYIPRGPAFEGDPARLWPLLRHEIDRAAGDQRAIMTLIEPDRPLGLRGTFREAGVVRGPTHLQPGRTVKVPLGDDDAILARMHQKTRYNVRLAQRRGVTIERVGRESIDAFYALMEDTATRNEFGIHSRSYYADFLESFAGNAIMLFARVDEGALGAALIAARFGREAIYMYGASSTVHRAHGAAFLLQYEAMRWARDAGCDTYDLWGIPEEDPEPVVGDGASGIGGTKGDDWRGLYRFKTGFGGDVVTYPSMMERRHVPLLPWLARKLHVIKA